MSRCLRVWISCVSCLCRGKVRSPGSPETPELRAGSKLVADVRAARHYGLCGLVTLLAIRPTWYVLASDWDRGAMRLLRFLLFASQTTIRQATSFLVRSIHKRGNARPVDVAPDATRSESPE